MKKKVLVPILFVAIYLVTSTILLTVFGRAGHGWGITAFYYISFPFSYISVIIEDVSKSGELAMLSCLLAGILQYALLGYLAQRFIKVKSSYK